MRNMRKVVLQGSEGIEAPQRGWEEEGAVPSRMDISTFLSSSLGLPIWLDLRGNGLGVNDWNAKTLPNGKSKGRLSGDGEGEQSR